MAKDYARRLDIAQAASLMIGCEDFIQVKIPGVNRFTWTWGPGLPRCTYKGYLLIFFFPQAFHVRVRVNNPAAAGVRAPMD